MLFQRICRRIRLLETPIGFFRKWSFVFLGGRVGEHTRIPSRTLCPWPHQVKLGSACILQTDIFFNADCFWKPGPTMVFGDRTFIGRGCEFNISNSLIVGDDCLIASGVKIIDHDHGTSVHSPIASQSVVEIPVTIGRGVWIGVNAVILKGVCIGDGAVIGAGSVVTHSVPAREVWCGVPAAKIGQRE